ncbi:MAG: TetR/AcrR family transcriptional regulator [Actinomycetota bacterium]|nr:TetR/AcrR family transcriptional regulator [Actinomycetota bacterium]
MARVSLVERRRTQTRHEIAKVALGLFRESGYDRVTAEKIAEESGVSLRTFYRYFSGKDEVLSPIMAGGTEEFAGLIGERPADEDLSTAVERAYEQMRSRVGTAEVRGLMELLTAVPTLRAHWMADLRTIEDALVPVISQRAGCPLEAAQARLTAAAIVTALRVTLELSTQPGYAEPLGETLGNALRYLRDGASL